MSPPTNDRMSDFRAKSDIFMPQGGLAPVPKHGTELGPAA